MLCSVLSGGEEKSGVDEYKKKMRRRWDEIIKNRKLGHEKEIIKISRIKIKIFTCFVIKSEKEKR